jgi:osmotically-inducible protein OsmY
MLAAESETALATSAIGGNAMQSATWRSKLERELSDSGLDIVVEESDDSLILSGLVDSAEARRAASDIVAGYASGRRIDNQLEVVPQLPETVADLTSDEPSQGDLPGSVTELRAQGGEIEPDFTDQPLLTDPTYAAGPSSGIPGQSDYDPVESGDEVYTPPTDPVVALNELAQPEVLGGFAATALDDIQVERSASDGRLGDEAIEDAIRSELQRDAATSGLEIHVLVRQGIARLTGRVPTLDDAENAEEVAARVPGVVEVHEALDVSAL